MGGSGRPPNPPGARHAPGEPGRSSTARGDGGAPGAAQDPGGRSRFTAPGALLDTVALPETTAGGDTIAAIATAIGESAVAVVRVSGPSAVDIAAPLIRSRRALRDMDSHRLARVTLVDPRNGNAIDDALCAVMRGPRSYTGEDTVEIFCHGSPALARMLIERLVVQGARLAEPGEFTRRAFMNGRLDLAQAEAVALLIEARTEEAVTLAARAVRGDLAKRIDALRDGLLGIAASLEVALDFPDDVEGWDRPNTLNKIMQLQKEVEWLILATRRGLVSQVGLTVAIVGAPNAGKSSLFNALLGRERAIVTPEAGTTRDVLEGTIVVSGVQVRLQDTAGIGTPQDAIDAEGMRRAGQAIEESDLVMLVVDGSCPTQGTVVDGARPGPADLIDVVRGRPHLVILSKSDLRRHSGAAFPPGAIPVSVVTADGLDAVMDRLVAEVAERTGKGHEEAAMAASLRQVGLLDDLSGCVERAGEALCEHPVEIALIELKGALTAASDLLGIEVGDAVLDAIFSRFCVGK